MTEKKDSPRIESIFFEKNLKISAVEGRQSFIDRIARSSSLFHEEIEIKYFYEGSSTLLIGKETVTTSPGDIIVINPYEFHSTINYGEERGKYHLLMIGLDFFAEDSKTAPDLRNLFFSDRIRFQTLIRNNSRLQAIINFIISELRDHREYYDSVVRGLVLELFSLLLRDYLSDTKLDIPSLKNIRYSHIIAPALHKLRTDYAEHFSVDDLAAMCSVSKYHFCRIFKEVTSLSVIQYQNEYRLQIADALLKKTKKSISEISMICGFDDLSYFSRCYKKFFGRSPQASRAILSK